MTPAEKIKMGSKISKTMLANHRRKYMMPPPRQHDLILEKITPEQRTLLAPRIAQFYRALEQQTRRDTETLASLVRVLSKPRGADAERLIELLQEKLESRGNP
jgi:hypothetical protein